MISASALFFNIGISRKGIFQYGMIGECPLFRRIGEKNKRVEYLKDGLVPEVYSGSAG